MSVTHEHLWYTRRQGQIRGPFPQQQITHYILLGRIRDDDELSTDRESWTPVQLLPHLIPEVMKNVTTEEDRQRLQLARMRADERRGGDRRSERMQRSVGERRREADRRQEEDALTLRLRQLRRSVLDEGRQPSEPVCGTTCRRVFLVLASLLAVFVLFTPEGPAPDPDCAAAPAPEVNWNNCRMPGLVAEQADLSNAQARNMDLTGARLVGADLQGADLAYSTLTLADLRRAMLNGAQLIGAGLRAADLRGARLVGADLSYADLRGAQLDGADLEAARLDNGIWFDGRVCQPGSVGDCR